jgi:RecA-family ATPase
MRSPEEDLADAGMEEIPPINGADSETRRDTGETQEKQKRRVAPLVTLRASMFAGMPAPRREFQVQGLIPARAVTLLFGDGGTGKSLVGLQLAAATVWRSQWLGLPVVGGSAVYFSAEDDRDELHRRLIDIARNEGRSIEELDSLHLVPLAGQDAILALTQKSGLSALIRTPLFESLERAISEISPALVVIDTLADVFGGEENNRAHARYFIRLLSGIAIKRSTAILVLAHPSLDGLKSGRGTSGSTAWNNSVRSRLYLDHNKDAHSQEADPDVRVLRIMKANYAPIGGEIRLRWFQGVYILDTPSGTSPAWTRQAAEQNSDIVFLQLVEAYRRDGRNVSSSTGPNYAPVIFSRDHRAAGVSKKALEAAMNRLFDAKRIKTIPVGPPSRQRKTIVVVEPNNGKGAG